MLVRSKRDSLKTQPFYHSFNKQASAARGQATASAAQPMPKMELESAVGPVSGGVKKKSKKSIDGDYKKKRRQPPSEEALSRRRAAQKVAESTPTMSAAAILSPRNPAPKKKKNEGKQSRKESGQVYVEYRYTAPRPSYKPGVKTAMKHFTSGRRLVDVGSAEHIAAQMGHWLGGRKYSLQ